MSKIERIGNIDFYTNPEEAIANGKSNIAIAGFKLDGRERLIMFKKGVQPWIGYMSSPNTHIRDATNREVKSVRRWRNLKVN